jgi:hypothetical protein
VGEPRISVAETRGQLGDPEEGEHPPLEAVARGLVKVTPTQKTSVCTE